MDGMREQALSLEQSLLQQFLELCSQGSPYTHTLPSTTPAFALGECFWEAGEGNQLQGFLETNPCSLPEHRIILKPGEVPSSAGFCREGEVKSAPEIKTPGRSILRSKAEGGWSKIPTFYPPSLAL